MKRYYLVMVSMLMAVMLLLTQCNEELSAEPNETPSNDILLPDVPDDEPDLKPCWENERCDEFSNKDFQPVFPFSGYSNIACIARITYNSADWSLCAMDASGNGMRKIVDMTVACQKPARSYSGKRLLFNAVKDDYWSDENNVFHSSRQSELYVIDIDGTGLTLIDRICPTDNGSFGFTAWSPDDNHIAYVRSYDNYWDKTYLILYNLLNNTVRLIPTKGNICTLSFSPDGKHIAYCATVKTDDITSGNNHHIYKMDIDGQNIRLIIKNAGSPKWSPQGNKIVYSISGKDWSSQIAVANSDGSGQKQLTTTVESKWWDTGFPRGGNSDPQWTPDGKKIVYVSQENDREEIFIMNVDGSKQTRLTKAEYWDGSPEVTPDGKSILFQSRRSDIMESGICIMNLNGSNQKVLSKVGARPIACK